MPLVEVTLTQGRTPEKLRALITALTDAVVDTEVSPRESVRVILREVPATHFAAGGETLAERRTREAQNSSSAHQNPEGE